MKHKILYTIIALFVAIAANSANSRVVDINSWKHYIAYADAQKVLPVGNDVFVLSSGRLYSFTISDGYPAYTEYSTITGLSDHNDIVDIQYNSSLRKFIIAYENANIDILSLKDGNIVNIPAIVNLSTINTKSVRNVFCYGKNAYVTTPWGIVIINMERAEVMDTYRLDTDIATGEQLSGCFIDNGYLYVTAKTARPQWNNQTMARGLLTDNLLDKNKWTPVDDAALQADITKKISDYRYANSLYDAQAKKRMVEDTAHKCFWTVDDEGSLVKCNSNGEIEKSFNIDTQKEYAKTYKPYGPKSNNIYNIQFKLNNLYCVSTGMQTKGSTKYNPNTGVVQVLNTTNDKWNVFETPSQKTIGHTYTYTNNLTIDPRDTAHVMVGGNEGIYEFVSGKFIKHYDNQNSPILALQDGNSKTYQIIMGLEYDKNGRLWVLNTFCSRGIIALDQLSPRDTTTANNIWHTFAKHNEIDTFTPYEKYLSHPFFDRNGKLWFINGHFYKMSFYRYDTETDRLKEYVPSKNQDNITVYDNLGTGWLRDIKEDNNGNIWVAGTKGIAYIPYDEQNTISNTVYQHKINRNDNTGLADYLLKTIDASCILFDKNNCMYVSTFGNGIYIISADKNEELAHFTTSNSNILSDVVYYLAFDNNTGVLYASTDKGLCSVQTDGWPMPTELNKDNIKVFPNPVKPEYTGPITIEGLPADSDIKIVTSSGAIVHQGRSTNSYYQWDGCDLGGDRCASGVYYILLANSNGDDGCVAKIAMIR